MSPVLNPPVLWLVAELSVEHREESVGQVDGQHLHFQQHLRRGNVNLGLQ